jgi:hypothetical protein
MKVSKAQAGARSLFGIFIGVCAMASAPALASGYVSNAAQWTALTPPEKAAYAVAVNDTANYLFINDDLATALVKAARTRCLLQTKTSPPLLADIITNGYAKDASLANQPPYAVYVIRLAEICKPYINEERTRIGLPPL